MAGRKIRNDHAISHYCDSSRYRGSYLYEVEIRETAKSITGKKAHREKSNPMDVWNIRFLRIAKGTRSLCKRSLYEPMTVGFAKKQAPFAKYILPLNNEQGLSRRDYLPLAEIAGHFPSIYDSSDQSFCGTRFKFVAPVIKILKLFPIAYRHCSSEFYNALKGIYLRLNLNWIILWRL